MGALDRGLWASHQGDTIPRPLDPTSQEGTILSPYLYREKGTIGRVPNMVLKEYSCDGVSTIRECPSLCPVSVPLTDGVSTAYALVRASWEGTIRWSPFRPVMVP